MDLAFFLLLFPSLSVVRITITCKLKETRTNQSILFFFLSSSVPLSSPFSDLLLYLQIFFLFYFPFLLFQVVGDRTKELLAIGFLSCLC